MHPVDVVGLVYQYMHPVNIYVLMDAPYLMCASNWLSDSERMFVRYPMFRNILIDET